MATGKEMFEKKTQLPEELPDSEWHYTGATRLVNGRKEYLVFSLKELQQIKMVQEAWGDRVYYTINVYWLEHYDNIDHWGRAFNARFDSLDKETSLALQNAVFAKGYSFCGGFDGFIVASKFFSIGD